MPEWPWRYRSRSKVIMRDTPSHASDLLCLYGKNPSRTVDVTVRTRHAGRTYFSSFITKSCLHDLEDIDQGQRSLCATHPLMLVVICAWYGKNPSRTVDVTERTQHAGRTNGRTDGQTDGGSETNIPPNNFVLRGYNNRPWPTLISSAKLQTISAIHSEDYA